MPTTRREKGFVYRLGRRTEKNCTPRIDRDTSGVPGLREPGLSARERLGRLVKGDVALKIDLTLLAPPLQAFADDPTTAGELGHVTITPVDSDGRVDEIAQREWASTRADEKAAHRFTKMIFEAIVENVKGTRS